MAKKTRMTTKKLTPRQVARKKLRAKYGPNWHTRGNAKSELDREIKKILEMSKKLQGRQVRKLKSKSSHSKSRPLSIKQEMNAWDAGYEGASYLTTKYKRNANPLDVFLWVIENDRRVPSKLNENHPSFWEYEKAVMDGAKAYLVDRDY